MDQVDCTPFDLKSWTKILVKTMNPYWGHPFPGAVNAGMDSYLKYPGPGPNDNGYNNHHCLNQQQQHSTTTTIHSNSRWARPGSSFQNGHCTEPKAEEDLDGDTDGLPFESDEEDPELTRKRKELQMIEEQIILKKASLAQRTVNVQNSLTEICSEEPKSIKSNETLRERVKHMLQVRNRVITTNGSLVTSRRHTFNAVHDHPLKFRVAVAQQQRFDNPPEEPQKSELIPFLKTSPPCQKEPSPVKEEVNITYQGFMRFLNVLNKGVYIDKLMEILSDETDDMPLGAQPDIATSSVKPPVTVREKLPGDYSFHNVRNKRKDNDELTDMANDKTDDMPHRSQTDRTSSVKSPVIAREKLREEYSFLNIGNRRKDSDELTEIVNDETGDMPHRSQTKRTTASVKPRVIIKEKLRESYSFLNKGVDNDKLTEIVNDKTVDMTVGTQKGPQTDRTSSVKPPVIVREKLREDYSLLNIRNKSVYNDKLTEMVIDETDDMPHSSQTDRATCSVKSPGILRERQRENYDFVKILNKELDNDKLTVTVNDETDDMPLGTQTVRTTSSVKPPIIVREKLREDYSFLNTHKRVYNDKLTDIGNYETGEVPLCRKISAQTDCSTSSVKPPVIVREKLPEEEQRTSADDPQKQLRNILESLGLSLDTDEISRLSDRTQERLYGKKQRTKSKRTESADASEGKTQTEQPQQKREKKYSPAHDRRSLSGSKSHSPSNKSRSRLPSQIRSPSPLRSSCSSHRSRHSHSPNRIRNSFSPYRKRKNPSPHSTDHVASPPKLPSPLPPIQFQSPLQLSPFLPPIMNPAHFYIHHQYTAYQNHLAYNQAPVPGPNHFSNQNYPHNTFPFLPDLSNAPLYEPTHEETTEASDDNTVQNTHCLASLTPYPPFPRKKKKKAKKKSLNNNWACNQAPFPGPNHFSNQTYPHNSLPFLPNLPNAPLNEPTQKKKKPNRYIQMRNMQKTRCLVSVALAEPAPVKKTPVMKNPR